MVGKKVKIDSLMSISIILYGIKYFLDSSTFDGFESSVLSDSLLYTSLFMYGIFMLLSIILYSRRKITLKVLLLLILISGITLLIRNNISYTIYFIFLLFVIGAKFSDPEKMMKTITWVSSIMLIGLALLSIVGIIPNIEESPGRYSLGLKSRTIGWHYFNICCCYFYINRNHLRNRMFIVSTIINLIIYSFTRTRLSAILVFVFLAFVYISWKKRIVGINILKSISKFIFPFLMIVTFFFTTNYSLFPQITELFVGRTKFGMRVLSNEGITLFPRNIIYQSIQTSEGYYTYYVDSGYLDLLIRFGIIVTVILITLYSYMLWQSLNKNNWVLASWIFCISIFNVVNCSFLNIFLESSLLLVWNMISKSKELYYEL